MAIITGEVIGISHPMTNPDTVSLICRASSVRWRRTGEPDCDATVVIPVAVSIPHTVRRVGAVIRSATNIVNVVTVRTVKHGWNAPIGGRRTSADVERRTSTGDSRVGGT